MMKTVETCMKNDRFAQRTDIELISVDLGHAKAKLTIQPHHLNGLGTVQGGAIFTLGDFTFAAAANSHGIASVAINASITFMKAATTGVLWAEAKEISKNFKIGVYTVEIRDDQGDLVAEFQGLAYRKKEKLGEEKPASV
jgi:acyl-CoA thioesterase